VAVHVDPIQRGHLGIVMLAGVPQQAAIVQQP
jgi:hypothetical protein